MSGITIISQALLFGYFQAASLLDLYPFNNVRHYSIRERLAGCVIHGALMGIPLTGFALSVQWMILASLAIYPVLLAGEYLNWWHFYLFGPSASWKETYDRYYKNTFIVLPPIKDHPVPNLEHTILHGLMLTAAILTYISYFTAR